MKQTQKIYIDGVETRRRIDEIVGRKNGTKAYCIEKGFKPETLNMYCRNGYGSPEMVEKFIIAGIPVALSSRPVPCRAKKEHRRTNPGDIARETEIRKQIDLETIYPEQFQTVDLVKEAKIKEILIRGLESIIEELRRI